MKTPIKFSAAFILLLIFLAFSLRDARAMDFTDEINRSVTLATFPPKRIVSLSPNVTEILFELGLDDEIVGVTRECNYPPSAKDKTRVSEYLSVNMELLVSLKPDLILVAAEGALKEQVAKIERLGLPLYAVQTKNLRDIQTTIESLGRVTGREDAGKKLALSIKNQIEQVALKLKGAKKKTVFCAVGVEPLIGVGPNTLIGDVIKAAGGINIIGDDGPDWPMVNLEELYVKDPDVIILSSMGSEVAKSTTGPFIKKISKLSAYKNDTVFTVNADTLCRASYRIGEALQELAEKMHPKLMGVKE